MMNVSRETKATLTARDGGRVIAWHNDREPRTLSLAVPSDRAKLSPVEARNLAAWLIEAAKAVELEDRSPFRTATLGGASPRTW
ncbi:hypothetical protein ACFY04_25945 [Streptomyces sp. NPDC001549]|uniref:hypothetical protein n=1 Tax=Streptomyces sp. NPDC001549 TaxID=3364586 RepID=UPI0036A4BF22